MKVDSRQDKQSEVEAERNQNSDNNQSIEDKLEIQCNVSKQAFVENVLRFEDQSLQASKNSMQEVKSSNKDKKSDPAEMKANKHHFQFRITEKLLKAESQESEDNFTESALEIKRKSNSEKLAEEVVEIEKSIETSPDDVTKVESINDEKFKKVGDIHNRINKQKPPEGAGVAEAMHPEHKINFNEGEKNDEHHHCKVTIQDSEKGEGQNGKKVSAEELASVEKLQDPQLSKTLAKYTLNQNISDDVLQALGNLNESIESKEKRRRCDASVNETFFLTTEEWNKMIHGRGKHRFSTHSNYGEAILNKTRSLYSVCVLCIRNQYLVAPEGVVKLDEHNLEKYYDGYVRIYCAHSHCCCCAVSGTVSFFSAIDHVEGRLNLSGERSHERKCVRSRPVKGLHKQNILEKLANQSSVQVYRELKQKLSEDEMYYGASTYAPSQSVLRNLKHQSKVSLRYSDNWAINMEIMRKMYRERNNPCIRETKMHPPSVTVYSDVQIKLFHELCRKDIVYFDATGSLIKRNRDISDFQMYTLLVRNPYKGGPAFPVATQISDTHDAASIRRFSELFLVDVAKTCGSKKKHC